MTDAPLWGDTGGHTGTAPTHLHHIFPHIPHKQNNHLRAIHSNDTNRPTRNSSQTKSTVPHVICPNETVGANIRAQFSQAKCVGAAPMCPPERPRSGVSIPKTHALCAGDERWMHPCGATRAGTQAPPLPISTKPRGVPLPHHIVHSIAHANHVARHYPIGVILSIAQGWQVQRSLSWVTMQARRLPTTWVVLFPPHCFFMPSPHTHRGRKCIAHSRPHS